MKKHVVAAAVVLHLLLLCRAAECMINITAKDQSQGAALFGSVEMQKAGSEEWASASSSTGTIPFLKVGDKIRTLDNGVAIVLLGTDAVASVSPNSTIEISEVSPGSDQADQIILLKGELMAKIQQEQPEFSIRTPTAIAAIAGLSSFQFSVSVDENDTTTIRVFDGTISVTNDSGSARPEASFMVSVMKDSAPGEPEGFDTESYLKSDSWLTILDSVAITVDTSDNEVSSTIPDNSPETLKYTPPSSFHSFQPNTMQGYNDMNSRSRRDFYEMNQTISNLKIPPPQMNIPAPQYYHPLPPMYH